MTLCWKWAVIGAQDHTLPATGCWLVKTLPIRQEKNIDWYHPVCKDGMSLSRVRSSHVFLLMSGSAFLFKAMLPCSSEKNICPFWGNSNHGEKRNTVAFFSKQDVLLKNKNVWLMTILSPPPKFVAYWETLSSKLNLRLNLGGSIFQFY